MSYYYSKNKQYNPIEIKKLVLALQEDNDPYYRIKFIMAGHLKFEWEYYHKEERDKELAEILELHHADKKAK